MSDPLSSERIAEIRRGIDGSTWCDTPSLLRELLDGLCYYRSRCPVTADDVARAGVTPFAAASWTDPRGVWSFKIGRSTDVAVSGPGVDCGGYSGSLAFCITQMALTDERSAHEILESIAASR